MCVWEFVTRETIVVNVVDITWSWLPHSQYPTRRLTLLRQARIHILWFYFYKIHLHIAQACVCVSQVMLSLLVFRTKICVSYETILYTGTASIHTTVGTCYALQTWLIKCLGSYGTYDSDTRCPHHEGARLTVGSPSSRFLTRLRNYLPFDSVLPSTEKLSVSSTSSVIFSHATFFL